MEQCTQENFALLPWLNESDINGKPDVYVSKDGEMSDLQLWKAVLDGCVTSQSKILIASCLILLFNIFYLNNMYLLPKGSRHNISGIYMGIQYDCQ